LIFLALFELGARIDGLLADPRLNGASVSCVVEDAEGHRLYERNPDLRLLPASNEKLVTTSFALWKLGPDYRCRLLFWKERKGLIVRATGDPLITKDVLVRLGERLNPKHKPVFLSEAYAPGFNDLWQLGDLPNRYSAPVTALTVDRAGLELWSVKGKPKLKPDNFGIRIEYHKSDGQPSDEFDVFKKRIVLTGTMPAKDTRLDTLCIPDPDIAAARYLGGRVFRQQTVPKRALDFVYYGSTMRQLLPVCLQKSDNNIAENFLLMAASAGSDLPSRPYSAAVEHLQTFLKGAVDLGPERLRPADGSGLARWNFVTTSGLAALLRWNLSRPTAPFWLDSLDRPGLGTLTTRMPGVAFRGKTGTLTGVSAISGYLEVSGKQYVISLVTNSFLVPSGEIKGLEDRVITAIRDELMNGTRIAGSQ
jgi:D-alanyl-D-alanine carboxypeptidase/D-alanyl-D-alanine-endopeptidase (penicillin-binding protein 4)